MISLLRGSCFVKKTRIGRRPERILPDAIGFEEQTSTPSADDFYFGGPSLLALPVGFVNRHVGEHFFEEGMLGHSNTFAATQKGSADVAQ